MKALCAFAGVALFLLLAVPSGLDSCGFSPPGPVFTAKRRPADVNLFVKGRVGVVQGAMRRPYLIGAYRMLSGVPLTDNEAQALYLRKPAPVQQSSNPSPVQRWLKTRERIPGATAIPYLQTDRNRTTAGSFQFFTNCLDDAFTSAANTLEARAKLWGDTSSNLKAWLTAQDQVFSNCGGEKPAIPDPPSPGTEALLSADRRYQIAAAYFYVGDWNQARQAFEEIATDASSPWSGIAPYLAGRASLRDALVENHAEAFDAAEKTFNGVLQDPARSKWHQASRNMLDLIRTRRDPAARLRQLGEELMKPDGISNPRAAAEDFVYLYGRGEGGPPPANSGELAEWIERMESPSPQTSNSSATRWKNSKNAAWLIAALAQSKPEDAAELVRAAKEVQPGSPAYESAVYYGIELELKNGHKNEARSWADDVLQHNLLLSTRNLILGQRLQLARDWSEYLRYAPRRPEPHLEDSLVSEDETDDPPGGTEPIFDTDSIAIWNTALPLSLWLDAAGNRSLPPYLQLQLAEAGWVRAVLLSRDREARAFMERIIQLKPAYTAATRPFLSATNPDAARYAAVLILLRLPDMVPTLEGGNSAHNLSEKHDSGGGRWCFGENTLSPANAPAFLSTAQMSDAIAELEGLQKVSASGANYLASQVIAWARIHADDPNVPEALHLSVQATRRGCTNPETGALSKQAFDLLHRQYPKSPWTARTRYWYK